MSEDHMPPNGVAPAAPALADVRAAGSLLRQAREAQGMQIDVLAVLMKVPVKKLEALEAGTLEMVHDAVFIRALAAGVCRVLKIDAAPVLNLLPQTSIRPLVSTEDGINAPFPGQGAVISNLSLAALWTKPRILFVLAVVLLVVALFFLPDIHRMRPPVPQTGVEEGEPPSPVEPAPSAPAPAPDAVLPVPFTPPATPPASALVAPHPVLPPSVGAAANLLVLRVRNASWVRIADAKGVVQLSRNVAPGEVITSDQGTLPLSVVVGRADAVEAEVRGQAMNLVAIAKDNVARFEVQ